MSRYLTFRTAGLNFAADFSDVIRIVALEDTSITPAPNFPGYMPGTAAIDGEAVPVIDTSLRFGVGDGINSSRACCVISGLDPSSGMTDRYSRAAVLVEEVTGILEAGNLSPAPALNRESFARYVKGTFISGGVTYYVISPELLVSE